MKVYESETHVTYAAHKILTHNLFECVPRLTVSLGFWQIQVQILSLKIYLHFSLRNCHK